MMNDALIDSMFTAIDRELRSYVDTAMADAPVAFKEIFNYQLGWVGEQNGKQLCGKRTRPLLLLLVCNALGGDWIKAIPAAISVELLHNYTLIHDDIEDRSLTRRGRECIWVKWGEAQAINTGDAMCALACSACCDLRDDFSESTAFSAIALLNRTNFKLTNGQYLDMAFEHAEDVTLDAYWKMVQGKTGELISACFELGGLLAGYPVCDLIKIKNLGMKIGVAFQVQDDWLGIWGNQTKIGKSTQSDLRDRKKTYPILMAIKQLSEFRDYWVNHNPFIDRDIERLLEILDHSNIKAITMQQSDCLYDDVLSELSGLFPHKRKLKPLQETIEGLLKRSM